MEKRELTQIQKNWILDTFFGSWTYNYSGARTIGEALIESGFCYVPGNKCIFECEVGNFIRTSIDNNCVGCLKYEFDFDYFMNSEYFKEAKTKYCDILYRDIEELKLEFKEIEGL